MIRRVLLSALVVLLTSATARAQQPPGPAPTPSDDVLLTVESSYIALGLGHLPTYDAREIAKTLRERALENLRAWPSATS